MLELAPQIGNQTQLQRLAEGSPITAKDLDEMLDFFENTEIDQSNPGWGDNDFPSVDWIRWQLMGGIAGWHWTRTTKELTSTMDEKL